MPPRLKLKSRHLPHLRQQSLRLRPASLLAPAPATTPSQPHRVWVSAATAPSVANAVKAVPVVRVPQVDVTPAAAHPAPQVTVVPVLPVQTTALPAPQVDATRVLPVQITALPAPQVQVPIIAHPAQQVQVQITALPAPQAAVQVATAPHPT